MVKGTTFPETCLWSVYERVMHEKAKMHGNQPIWEYQTTLPKTCLLSVFELLTYQNGKIHVKHHYRETQHHQNRIF